LSIIAPDRFELCMVIVLIFDRIYVSDGISDINMELVIVIYERSIVSMSYILESYINPLVLDMIDVESLIDIL